MARTGYDVVLFTDANTRMWHGPPLGAYCVARVLREQGYTVKVIDFLQRWIDNIHDFNTLIKQIIDQETIFIGFSGKLISDQGFARNSREVKNWTEFHRLSKITTWPTTDIEWWGYFLKKLRERFPQTKLVYGGHVSAEDPISLLDNMDFIVKGLAEITVIDLINHLKHNKPIKYNPSGRRAKIIDYDINASEFDFRNTAQRYEPTDNLLSDAVLTSETSRGCALHCAFCDMPQLGRKKGDLQYHKSVEVLAEEFRRNYELFGIKKYFFCDHIFNETTAKIENVLRARDISGVDFKCFVYIRYEIINKYPEQIALLKQLGMSATFIGIESLYHESAKSVGKGTHPEKVKEILYRLKDQWKDSVNIQSGFIIGLPYDTHETLDTWIPWIMDKNCPIDSLSITPLTIDTNSLDKSLIARNPQKYGYTLTGNGTWKNSYWDYNQALSLVHSLENSAWQSGRQRVGGFDQLGMETVGYDPEYIRTVKFKDIDFTDVSNRMISQFNRYKAGVFDFENKRLKNLDDNNQ